ncbi:MAG: hypothetical protein Q8L78_03365 [Coxiellaceae bacterium]|nr:hypothetical protein [Coxiellaceae bacterium]
MGQTLANNFSIIAIMMQSVSVFMGVCFTLGGLFQLKKVGENRMGGGQSGATGPLLMLLCGALLFILPSFMGAFGLALFGSVNDLGYDGTGTDSGELMAAVLMFVRLIGVGSFMRGIVLISRSGGHQAQPGTLSKAVVHMISGLLCLHIEGTIYIFEELLGLVN